MRLDALLPRQDSSGGCIKCPPTPPCNCAANQDCFQILGDCNSCATFKCVAKPNSAAPSSSGGASKGALAGGIVGALVFLGAAIAAFFWYRRGNRFGSRAKRPRLPPVKPDIPAPAEDVLKRPDPTEKLTPELSSIRRMYSTSSNTTIDLDPESRVGGYHTSQSSIPPNPFEDTHSIQTAVTEGTNVIPIALVSPESGSLASSTTSGPVRPVRSPDLNLNLEHVNVSGDSIRPPAGYALSQISGISGVSSRHSYMSGASYSSDLLNEAPMIITPTKGTVRQVVGVVKAEVINAPAMSPTTSEGLRPPTFFSKRPSVRSPLASTSFGPGDIANEDGQDENPFSDKHSTMASPSASVTTFGQPSVQAERDSMRSDWVVDSPTLPWTRNADSRPSSLSTQAGSVIGIENATRVHLGLSQLTEASQTAHFPRSPYRTTMGRLVSPSSAGLGTLEEQQQQALAHAQAQAEAQGLEDAKRASGSSFFSTRADSILESFPFVPPSPISNRPMRSPPVSPLAQQSFTNQASSPTESSKSTATLTRPPPQAYEEAEASDSELPAPPDRRMLGMSTASQLSTASSGLGSFPFQIDSGPGPDASAAPSAFPGRQRASLDTLALTSDLSSYPLGFDRDSKLPDN